jgi:flagellar hook-associated protein 3 FlgL
MSTPRITSSMMSRGILADLNDVATRVSDTQRKMATGKELTRPSDDPFAVGRALGLRTELEGLGQYRRNVAEGQAWTDASDAALATITDIAQRARELLVRAANGTTAATEREAIAQEIDQLIDAAKQDANADNAGRAIFGGTITNVKPYDMATDTYHGDGADIVRTIGPGVSVRLNPTGGSVLGDGADGKALQTLRDIAAHLRGGTAADANALRTTDLAALDASMDAVSTARAEAGALTNRLTTASNRLHDLQASTEKVRADVETVDLAEAISNLSSQQAIYQAALQATGSSLNQRTLMDFLG